MANRPPCDGSLSVSATRWTRLKISCDLTDFKTDLDDCQVAHSDLKRTYLSYIKNFAYYLEMNTQVVVM